MNKRDLVLAQKTIAARQVKNEQKLIKDYLNTTKKNGKNTHTLNGNSANLSKSMEYSQFREELPDLSHTFGKSINAGTMGPPLQQPQGSQTHNKLSNHSSHLVNELAQRATTTATGLRKMNSDVAKTLQRNSSNKLPESPTASGFNRSFSDMPSRGSPAPASSDSEFNDNYFMPKVQKMRPDGATLSEIYQSKKEDTWAKILKAQLKEEEEQKIIKKKEKLIADEKFGDLLKKQINDNRAATLGDNKQNTLFAAMEGATAKRTDDLQKKRTEEAINRHKKFISNAIEDIQIKKEQREKAMLEEITASTIMINKAKALMAQDELKKQQDKMYHKQYQETLFKENLANLERKQKEKLKQFSEERRIIAENEKQFLKEQKRREDALASKLQRSSEGPAHHIVEHIVNEKKRQEEQFYETLFKTENSLNKQLKRSEDVSHARSKSNGDELTVEWIRNSEMKALKKKEDEDRNNKILQTMKKMLHDQEKEDIAKKEKQRQMALKYQQDLDFQLNTLRQKSQDALKKTMNEAEIKMNMDLIRKTHVVQ